MSPLLKRLEAGGYIKRSRDPEDERSLNLALTPEGKRLRRRALAIPPAIMGQLGMDVTQLQSLHAILTDVIGRTERANEHHEVA